VVRLIEKSTYLVPSKITNPTEKNAYLVSAPYHRQVYYLNFMNTESYPISCRYVKQPFAPKFKNLYFYITKAEELKWLTAKFLNHGIFEIWKGWEIQQLGLIHRRREEQIKKLSNSSSTEVRDINNFIGQVHLLVFYILISRLTGICIVVFIFECAIQNAQELLIFVLAKLIHVILEIYWTIFRFLLLVNRLLIRLYEKSLQTAYGIASHYYFRIERKY
jgi:hypothetical protein